MTQRAIPYHFLRGGTSRGPYFNRADLPEDRAALSAVLTQVIGSGNPRNIDGIGGGDAVTCKVAMLSPSNEDVADIDYFFAQVDIMEPMVDYRPTCGNILVGVGPAAIEMGLVPVTDDTTTVRIRAVNTGALVESVVQTPGGQVTYAGDTHVDGVPGTAAPVALNFLDVVGSKSGAMFPTGRPLDVIDGVEVTCIDVAMPMMIARAADFGLSGHETQAELAENSALFERMEPIRLKAGALMGFGDVSKSVVPKIGLIAPPRTGAHFAARYFMPWTTHPTLAVTGSQCLAACALAPGTVAEGIARPVERGPEVMRIEHPMGEMEVTVDFTRQGDTLDFRSAGVVRTARLIARGEVMVSDE
ncbi:4-oxalomesaconate tautomerase [Rhodobacteraceae bacterium N5(2021)]|uniref:4-oxalomesaconate tautomerase n=1 Tax=Gymnodinialimonas phycosphaerae TaxID=2841589 RepID=A0A975TWY6_9RHOB|nr:4-oxalomesaconate tautomerase [Gymnodinialimonas phycosphaerae]MBY4892193.1 4-oxalomesaconate tautomerase [Gymnodinialimonas phycosphaerae]